MAKEGGKHIKSKFWRKVYVEYFDTNEIFYANEIKSNKLSTAVLFLMAGLLLIFWILSKTGFLLIDDDVMNPIFIQGIAELLIPAILCIVLRYKKRWLKIVVLIEFSIVCARIDSVLTYNVPILIIIPIILSTRYYSRFLTNTISVITIVVDGILSYFSAIAKSGLVDSNFVIAPYDFVVHVDTMIGDISGNIGFDPKLYAMNLMRLYYLPRLLFIILVCVICGGIANSSRKMVVDQATTSKKTERISTELNLASDIQSNMLPNIFPAFPERDDFDVYATMTPAKEVGGDFYDFFMLDEKNIALVIADVSGKGVPAAMFMVITKTLIKDHAQLGLSPAEVFTRVNNLLCEGNKAGLFVTAWMGYLNLETGLLTFVNAGHNPPLIVKDGQISYLKTSAGFVLAGLEDFKYKQNEIKLNLGDKLFLYTDGVTEATNLDKELFGENRLFDVLSKEKSSNVVDALTSVRVALNDFVGEAEQFDDITMVAFDYSSKNKDLEILEKTFAAKKEVLPELLKYIETNLEKNKASMKATTQIYIAVEEIFVNIASYAYGDSNGKCIVSLRFEGDFVSIKFIDNGFAFNPLKKEDPNVKAKLEDRDIGGLGIFMVKQTMDEVSYKRDGNENVLVIKKNIR